MSDVSTQALLAAQTALMNQPFSALVGAEMIEIGEDHCALRIQSKKELQQQHGFLHGGVVSYAADNTLTIAGYLKLKQPVVTSEFKINYVRPAVGDAIIARAECIYAGKTQAVCRCNVYVITNGQEKLCAVAQGTVALLSKPAS